MRMQSFVNYQISNKNQMDIFNGNRKLEEVTMESLDWGVFLRHNNEGPIAPFMHLFSSEGKMVTMLMTDGDPLDFAKGILEKEEKPFQQFVIGMEGFLTNEQGEKIDSIIVQGFDKTQEKGVVLAQMFEPKEKTGSFKKLNNIAFLGNPELPIELAKQDNPDYSVEECGFNAVELKFGELTQYMAFFTHENPSIIASTMKQFLRSKIGGVDSADLNGRFEFMITPGMIKNEEYLKFLVCNAVDEERKSAHATEWETNTGRNILINILHGDTPLQTEFEKENQKASPEAESEASPEEAAVAKKTEQEKEASKYASFTEHELNKEYNRLLSIPNARTNISALQIWETLSLNTKQEELPCLIKNQAQMLISRRNLGGNFGKFII